MQHVRLLHPTGSPIWLRRTRTLESSEGVEPHFRSLIGRVRYVVPVSPMVFDCSRVVG